ncbi:hypothetical protein A9K76_15680 [Stenotrophomonas maltophilia]|nr:hypothetical protein A9K76_15680 [Stenotrophomonas maltophilia]
MLAASVVELERDTPVGESFEHFYERADAALMDALQRVRHHLSNVPRLTARVMFLIVIMWHSGLALNEASASVCPTAGASLYLDIGLSPERVTLVAPDTYMATSTCRVVAVLAPSRPILRASFSFGAADQPLLLCPALSRVNWLQRHAVGDHPPVAIPIPTQIRAEKLATDACRYLDQRS